MKEAQIILQGSTLYCVVGGAAIVLVLMIYFGFNYLKNKKQARTLKIAEQKAKEECEKLEQLLEDVTSEKEEYKKKCDILKSSIDKVEKIAYTDYLTELPNRAAFMDMLDNIMNTLRSDEKIAIMDIDIDEFKNINDSIGPIYGDQILIDVAYRLREALDENDFFARIGGDEFAILTQNIPNIGDYEEKLRKIQRVFSYPFLLATKEFFITISIGVTIAPKDGTNVQVLMKNMTTAMVAAKESGKNTYVYFEESLNQARMKKMELQSELRKALEEEQFIVSYQAQVALESGKVSGFEALIRWNHPEKGIIYPMDFIPAAEENGLIVPIGKIVIREACRQLKEWQEAGYKELHMAVNLSARQFKDKEFAEDVVNILNETGANPACLEFEITESIALENLDYTIKTMEELKQLGITFALDDFGTGYSSMIYLKHLPVNYLKIDKSFMDSVLVDNSDQKIVETILLLAKNLKLEVIAEGVEEKAQEEFLKKNNCEKAQGYLYSKPVDKYMATRLFQIEFKEKKIEKIK